MTENVMLYQKLLVVEGGFPWISRHWNTYEFLIQKNLQSLKPCLYTNRLGIWRIKFVAYLIFRDDANAVIGHEETVKASP